MRSMKRVLNPLERHFAPFSTELLNLILQYHPLLVESAQAGAFPNRSTDLGVYSLCRLTGGLARRTNSFPADVFPSFDVR